MTALPDEFLECRLFPEEHLFLAERGLIVSRVMAVSKGLPASKKASVEVSYFQWSGCIQRSRCFEEQNIIIIEIANFYFLNKFILL